MIYFNDGLLNKPQWLDSDMTLQANHTISYKQWLDSHSIQSPTMQTHDAGEGYSDFQKQIPGPADQDVQFNPQSPTYHHPML